MTSKNIKTALIATTALAFFLVSYVQQTSGQSNRTVTVSARNLAYFIDKVERLEKGLCKAQTGYWDAKKSQCSPALKRSSSPYVYNSIPKDVCGTGWHIASAHEAIIRYYLDPKSRNTVGNNTPHWTIGGSGHITYLKNKVEGNSALQTLTGGNSGAARCHDSRHKNHWPSVQFPSNGFSTLHKPFVDCRPGAESRYVLCARNVK